MVAERESGAELSTPETLHGLIAARLDALSQMRRPSCKTPPSSVRCSGSTRSLGRTRAAVEELLRSLERKEFLRRRRESSMEGQSEYAFHHVLVRDVAYSRSRAPSVRGANTAAPPSGSRLSAAGRTTPR